MAKYNITFIIQGPTGLCVEAPNTTNPVDIESLSTLLTEVADMLPSGIVETVGIRVEQEQS